ncbi:MAG: hypothetical protein AB7P33_13705 [Dehalococcoidia bacterium]
MFLIATVAYVGTGIADSPSSQRTLGIIPPFEMTMAYRTDIRPDGTFVDQGAQKYAYTDARHWVTYNYPPADGPGYLTTSELRGGEFYVGATKQEDPRLDGAQITPTFWFVERQAWVKRFDTPVAQASSVKISLKVRHEGANDVYRVIYHNGYGAYAGRQVYEEYVYIPELPVPVEVRWLDPDERVYASLIATSLVVDGVTVR